MKRWTNQALTTRVVAPGAWRGFLWDRLRWHTRCVGGSGTWWPLAGSSMRHQGLTGTWPQRRRARKNRRPGQGTSGVKLVVPPHFAAASQAATSARTARRRAMRQLGNGSRFALPGARRRLLRQMGIMPVRSGAQRSSSPAFLVPLRSDRGSLARSSRLLVLVITSVFDLWQHPTREMVVRQWAHVRISP